MMWDWFWHWVTNNRKSCKPDRSTDCDMADAVNAAFMICKMFAYYKTRGISLLDKLDEIYAKYGYCLNTLHSYEFDGSAGMQKMADIMEAFRGAVDAFGDFRIEKCIDYLPRVDGLPKSDVLMFTLEGGHTVVIRPSGTEPKLKVYISVTARDRKEASGIEERIAGGDGEVFAISSYLPTCDIKSSYYARISFGSL